MSKLKEGIGTRIPLENPKTKGEGSHEVGFPSELSVSAGPLR